MAQARAGYAAGAVTTTHLFNAMNGLTHRDPGLALAALLDDAVWVELIADGLHVDCALWPLIWRLKPADRVLLVSDAIALAGSGRTHGWVGELEVRVEGERVMLVEGGNLAGSVTALDLEMARVIRAGIPLPEAVRAASTTPRSCSASADRGRLEAGQHADIVVLDATLAVRRSCARAPESRPPHCLTHAGRLRGAEATPRAVCATCGTRRATRRRRGGCAWRRVRRRAGGQSCRC